MTTATFNLAHIRKSFSQLNREKRCACNYKSDTSSDALMESALPTDRFFLRSSRSSSFPAVHYSSGGERARGSRRVLITNYLSGTEVAVGGDLGSLSFS